METLRWFLLGLVDLLRDFMVLLGRGVAALAREFELDLTPELTNLLGIALGVWIIWGSVGAMTRWNRNGNQPQRFPLTTAQTPDQVVAADRNNFVAMIFRVLVVALVLVVVISLRG